MGKDEHHVHESQCSRGAFDTAGKSHPGRPPEAVDGEGEAGGDRDVHEGPGDGDNHFLDRLVRHALEAGDAAEGEQRDVGSANSVAPRREGVAEFVKQHAEENETC
jgi:hypothetical protein